MAVKGLEMLTGNRSFLSSWGILASTPADLKLMNPRDINNHKRLLVISLLGALGSSLGSLGLSIGSLGCCIRLGHWAENPIVAKVQGKPFFAQRGGLEKGTSPFFNVMAWRFLVDHKATVMAEYMPRKAVIALKKALLGLAHGAQHIGGWLFSMENF